MENLCVLPKNAKYFTSGSYNDVFKTGNGKILKVSYYTYPILREIISVLRSSKGTNTARAEKIKNQDMTSINSIMNRIGGYMIRHAICPHFVTVYKEKTCKNFYDTYVKSVINDKKRENRNKVYKEGLRYSVISIQEMFDYDLSTMLRDSSKRLDDTIMRGIIFEVIYTIYVLQHYIEGFRHNDLSSNNVLVKKGKVGGKTYAVGSNTYVMPAMDFSIAVNDFDITHATGKIKIPGFEHTAIHNKNVMNGVFARNFATPAVNPSYDVYYFLVTILKNLYSRRRDAPETMKFLNRILGPYFTGGNITDRTDKVIRSLYPDILLETDPYFEIFKIQRNTIDYKVVGNRSPKAYTISDKNKKDVSVITRCKNMLRPRLNTIATSYGIDIRKFKNKDTLCKEIHRVLSKRGNMKSPTPPKSPPKGSLTAQEISKLRVQCVKQLRATLDAFARRLGIQNPKRYKNKNELCAAIQRLLPSSPSPKSSKKSSPASSRKTTVSSRRSSTVSSSSSNNNNNNKNRANDSKSLDTANALRRVKITDVPGDGNCFYYAINVLLGNTESVARLRRRAYGLYGRLEHNASVSNHDKRAWKIACFLNTRNNNNITESNVRESFLGDKKWAHATHIELVAKSLNKTLVIWKFRRNPVKKQYIGTTHELGSLKKLLKPNSTVIINRGHPILRLINTNNGEHFYALKPV